MFKVNSKEKKERKKGRQGGREARRKEKEREREKEGLKEDWDLFFTLTKVKTEAHLFLLVMEGS